MMLKVAVGAEVLKTFFLSMLFALNLLSCTLLTSSIADCDNAAGFLVVGALLVALGALVEAMVRKRSRPPKATMYTSSLKLP